jgi:hypothetical protein
MIYDKAKNCRERILCIRFCAAPGCVEGLRRNALRLLRPTGKVSFGNMWAKPIRVLTKYIRPGEVMKSIIPCLAILAFSGSVQAQSSKGQFAINGKPLALSHIAAFRIRDQSNARQFETYVMWTPSSVNQKAISTALDPYAIAINDPAIRNADYVSFSVKADGNIAMNAHVGGTQYIDTSGKMMGETGSLKVSCRTNTPTRVDCDVSSPKPVKSMDGPTWQIQMSFSAPVLSKASGPALPADGGAAGKAFLAVNAAYKAKNKAILLAQLSPEDAAEFAVDWRTPEENLKALVQRFEWSLPKQPKVVGGETPNADTALLEVEDVPYPGGKMLYHVEMRKQGSGWRYIGSTMLGLLK